jgi:hypothetical protein
MRALCALLPAQSARADVFDFDIIVDTVFRPLASDTGFLDAAEGCNLGRDDALVQADDAALERLGNAP